MSDDDEYSDSQDKDIVDYGPVVANAGWIPKLFENNYRTTQLVFTKQNGRTLARLRQPRDLYALSQLTLAANLRWPCELQVNSQRPFHILYTPSKPEPLWKKDKEIENVDKRLNAIGKVVYDNSPDPDNVDKRPNAIGKVVHDNSQDPDNVDKRPNAFGKVVYDNSPDPDVKYFITSKTDCRSLSPKPYYALKDETDKTLIFESRFECGNLMRAIKVGEYDYQLWLKFDLYTKKHTQWFYFKVQNAHPNITYRFTIMNFLKSGSLYSEGMKPLLYSEKDALEKNIGWVRVGSGIKYYKNDIRVEDNKERCYYSLHWQCTFSNENDTYYFAHSYPYTYSDLQEYLSYLSSDSQRRKYCKQRVLCQSLAGNHIYILTITAPTRCPKQAKIKKVIVITARVHPGETVASWMMKGLLDFLTSNEPDAKILRETFIFKIIPMLNPDGVIVGNYRCSLAGRDLNRNYRTVLKDSFPSVWTTKLLVKKLQEERGVVLYCDFHGHSRKKNVFIYGCEEKHDKSEARLHTRIFPLILSKNAPDKFSFGGCRFKVQKSKEGTGRIVMWNMGVKNSYTMEASFCGSSSADGRDYHFCVQDYEAMGYHFCDSLLDLFDPDTSKFQNLQIEIEKRLHSAALLKMISTGELNEEDVDMSQLEYLSDFESESFGSDSSVSDGLPMQLYHAPILEMTKKKRLKSRKERNKNRKRQQKQQSHSLTTKETRLVHTVSLGKLSPIKEKKKSNHAKHCSSSMGKISYTSRTKDKCLSECRSSSRLTDTNEYLDNLTYSYVQASLFDSSLNENNTHRFMNSSLPCERCNPAYYLSLDASDAEPDGHRHHNANYSLYENRVPNKNTDVNPTLELARHLTAYNYCNGKLPPRMGKMFSIWSAEEQRREELLKRKTVNQGDNVDYLKKKLTNCRLEKQIPSNRMLSQEIRFPSSASVHPFVTKLTTTTAAASIATTKSTASTNAWPIDIAATSDLLLPEGSQRLRHVNSLALPSRAHSLSSNLLARRKYLPKLKGNIPMQPDSDSGFPLSSASRSYNVDLQQTKLTNTPKNNHTHARKQLARSLDNVPDDGKTGRDSKLAQRLVAFGGSGLLLPYMVPKEKVGNLKCEYEDALSMDDVVSGSSSGKSSSSMSEFQSVGSRSKSPSKKRAITPQQYCMFSNEDLASTIVNTPENRNLYYPNNEKQLK